MKRFPREVVVVSLVLGLLGGAVGLSQPLGPAALPPQDKGKMMLTIFFKHDQSKTLGQIQKELQATGFAQKFPPPETEVVSWYVLMGIGQVVTLRFPAEKLREVNLAIEQSAWGAFRTEFYPTYDFRAVAEAERKPSGKP
jgi:hypothetical protein